MGIPTILLPWKVKKYIHLNLKKKGGEIIYFGISLSCKVHLLLLLLLVTSLIVSYQNLQVTSVSPYFHTQVMQQKSAKTARLSASAPFRLRVTLTWTFHLSGWAQELLMLAELSLSIKLLVLRFACENLRQPVVNVCLPLFFLFFLMFFFVGGGVFVCKFTVD